MVATGVEQQFNLHGLIYDWNPVAAHSVLSPPPMHGLTGTVIKDGEVVRSAAS